MCVLLDHRLKGHQIIREFLFGDAVVNQLKMESELESESEEFNNYTHSWLYEHSARCPKALQLFLDHNPIYWCFIPIAKDTKNLLQTTIKISSPTPIEQRTDYIVEKLVKAIPTPPTDYIFSRIQREQQRLFFKFGYDRHPVIPKTVDLYNATVVVVCKYRYFFEVKR